MTIAIVFQLFVFRQPARRHLRLSLAAATAALESYSKLFQLYINEVAPVSEEKAKNGVSEKVLEVVQRELIRQELVIQEQILALMPIFEFAKIEPTWAVPFRKSLPRLTCDADGEDRCDDYFINSGLSSAHP